MYNVDQRKRKKPNNYQKNVKIPKNNQFVILATSLKIWIEGRMIHCRKDFLIYQGVELLVTL